jgi:hypothetical protein
VNKRMTDERLAEIEADRGIIGIGQQNELLQALRAERELAHKYILKEGAAQDYIAELKAERAEAERLKARLKLEKARPFPVKEIKL